MKQSSDRFKVYELSSNKSIIVKEQKTFTSKATGSMMNEFFMYYLTRRFDRQGFGGLIAAVISFEDSRHFLAGLHVPMRKLKRQVNPQKDFKFLILFDDGPKVGKMIYFYATSVLKINELQKFKDRIKYQTKTKTFSKSIWSMMSFSP